MSSFQPEFVFTQLPVRVRFGPGIRHNVTAEIERLNCSRAAVLSTPGKRDMAEDLAAAMGDLLAGVVPLAEMHTPVEVTERALQVIGDMQADCLIAIGGGSTIGLGKALALQTGLPQIVLPTTYAGSEATPVLGQTEEGRKVTLSDDRVRPQVILYDAELVRSLPVPVTVASGLNAMAHAVEALYARNRNPISTMLAVEGLRAFRWALPKVVAAPSDLEARGETLYGAWLCGTVLGQGGMALHHKLCHVLGGSFGLPHADTHAVILPYCAGFNAAATGDLLDPVRSMFGDDDVAVGLSRFAEELGAPSSLRGIGMREDDLERAADLVVEGAYWNPRTYNRCEIFTLLRSAWRGVPPVETMS